MISSLLTIAFFIFPGSLLLWRKHFLPSWCIIEKIPVVAALSVSYWVISFWFLTYIPIPLNLFLSLSLIASFLLGMVLWRTQSRKPTLHPKTIGINALLLGLFLLLALPAITFATNQIAPPGADMSMHAYLAKAIYLKNGFPTTLRPLVPLDQFGAYPIGFPTVIADMMLLNGLPVYTDALWLSAFTYWFFAVSIYCFLRSRFPRPISMVTTVLVSWVSMTPNDFIEWGANPTILSLDFLIIGLTFLSYLNDRWSLVFLFASVYTAFLTHYTVPVGLMYVSLPVLLLLGKPIMRQLANWRRIKPIVLVCVFLPLPFLLHLRWDVGQVSETTRAFVAGLHQEELSQWSGARDLSALTGVTRFLLTTFGSPILTLYLLAVLLLALHNRRKSMLHVIGIAGISLLVMNGRSWILPFSPLLYPKRVALLLLIFMSLGIADGLQRAIHALSAHGIRENDRRKRIWYALGILFIGYTYSPVMHINLRRFTASGRLSVVSKEDIAAFAWLAEHTTTDDIILNNYEDAGLWIPAITNRSITLYHTNPIDMDKLNTTQRSPTYAYVGNRTLTRFPDVDPINEESLSEDPKRYTKVYQNNRAAIYRIHNP